MDNIYPEKDYRLANDTLKTGAIVFEKIYDEVSSDGQRCFDVGLVPPIFPETGILLGTFP